MQQLCSSSNTQQLHPCQVLRGCRALQCSRSTRRRTFAASAQRKCTVTAQATADSAALQPPDSSGGSGTSDAVYIKSPVAGGVLEYPGRSVVVLGDVPTGRSCVTREWRGVHSHCAVSETSDSTCLLRCAGAVLRAGGDIIVLGRWERGAIAHLNTPACGCVATP